MYESVINQLRSAGLLIDSLEVDTKSIVRCQVEGDSGKKRSGWYRIFSVTSKKGNTYYVGSYGNWKNSALPEKGLAIEYEGKALSDEDRVVIQKKQQEAQRGADRERKAKSKEAAVRAANIWAELSEAGQSKYLAQKNVKGFGVRYSREAVVVPVCNVASDLLGLQFIYAGGDKKFLTGTPKAGAFHLIGVMDSGKPLIVAEGYATAASIHMATAYPVVVAFDAGNLPKVAVLLRETYPQQSLIVAADDDAAGLKYASQAAKKAVALIAAPVFADCPEGEKLTDFNDLHVWEGLPAVKLQIDSAGPVDELDTTLPVDTNDAVTTQASPDDTGPKSGYIVIDTGVFYIDLNSDNDALTRFRICGRLDVLARARDINGREWGLVLRFSNFDNQVCEWFVPMRLFAAERGSRVIEGLLDRGLDLDPHRNSKTRLLDYLQRSKPSKRVRLVGKLGWHGEAYVSPLGVIGEPEEPIYYYTERAKKLNRFTLAGSLEDWRDNVAAYCRGNPVLMFAVCISFAGPLLEWLGMKTIGFHMVGPSSLGKSSISYVAGSVCGGEDYVRTWNTTAAALEPTAAEHSDSVLILDEINQADPFTVGQTVYQLGNESGRARATDTGSGTRIQHSWRLVWLSNGERSLKEIQSRVGKVTEVGMEMRLLHIRADLHCSQRQRDLKGIYQELHGFAHGAALSEHLKQEVAKNHGYPFKRFIEGLTSTGETAKKKIVAHFHRKMNEFQHKHLSGSASGQARRAAMGFALVGLCGELASQQGITGWEKGEAESAASQLFDNFLRDRGGEGSAEDKAILEHICLELQTKAEAYFTRWDKSEPRVDTHQPRSMNRWGFRKVEESHSFEDGSYSEEEFYIFKLVFRKELCKGFSYRRACELLKERGALECHAGRGYLYQAHLPGAGKKKEDVYFIKMSALQDLLPEATDLKGDK